MDKKIESKLANSFISDIMTNNTITTNTTGIDYYVKFDDYIITESNVPATITVDSCYLKSKFEKLLEKYNLTEKEAIKILEHYLKPVDSTRTLANDILDEL